MKWLLLILILGIKKEDSNIRKIYFEGEGPQYVEFESEWNSLTETERISRINEFVKRANFVFEFLPPSRKGEHIVKGKVIKYSSRSDYVLDLLKKLKENPSDPLTAYKLSVNLQELEAEILKEDIPNPNKEPFKVFIQKKPPSSPITPKGGTGWSSDVWVAYSTLPEQVPSMTIDANGNLYMALIRGPKADTTWLDIYQSTNGGQSWSWYAGLKESSTQWNFSDPSIACDIGYNNRLIIAYTADYTISGYDADIYVGLYDPGTGWVTTADTIDNDSENDLSPWVTAEYQYGTYNYYYVVYHEPEGIFSRYGDDMSIHLRTSTDHGRTWGNHTSFGEGFFDISVRAQPYITNSEGIVYASYSYGDDWANREDIIVAKSTDFGTTWTETTVYDGTSTYPCYQASVASSHGGGSVLVVFQREFSSTDQDVLSCYSYDQGATWTFQYAPAYTTADERIPYAVFMGWGYSGNDVYGQVLVSYYKNGYAVIRVADYSNLTNFYIPSGISDTASDNATVLHSNWGQINSIWWKNPPGPGSARIIVAWTDTTYGTDYDVRAAYTVSATGYEDEVITAIPSNEGILLIYNSYIDVQKWEILKRENSKFVKKFEVYRNRFLDKEVKDGKKYSYEVYGYRNGVKVCSLGPVEVFYHRVIPKIGTFYTEENIYKILDRRKLSLYNISGRKTTSPSTGVYFLNFNGEKRKIIYLNR